MMSTASFRFVIVGAAVMVLGGCAHTVPAELTSARLAYERSSRGPAARLVPADLHKAKTALAKAEASFADEPKSFRTRDLAYVAQRKFQKADALASISADQDSTLQSRDDFSQMQGEIIDQSKSDLSDAQAALKGALARLAAVKEDDRGLVITLSGSVLFRSGESTLLPAAQTRLDQVAAALLSSPGRTLVVEGHTDSVGSDEDNQLLSQQRADAVRTYLIGRGYAAERIVAQGLGESRPIASNDTQEGRSNNRRVEIVIQRPGLGQARSSQ